MPVPSAITALSQTPGSNSPPGNESPTTADDYLRTYAAFIAILRDRTAADWPNTPAGNIVATNVQAALNELDVKKYARNSILGTVSQTAGVPTGAVIERGSNSNGEFVRFADGTQICTLVAVSDVASAGVPINPSATYPAAFISAPYLRAGIQAISTTFAFYASLSVNSVTTTTAVIVRRYDTAQTYTISAIAIGRWF